MGGFWAGDAIAEGLAHAATAQRYQRSAEDHLATVQKLVAERDSAYESIASNLAEKYALREALRKIDPKHPLLSNNHLLERIRTGGKRAFAINQNWDDARQAGATFKY